MSGRLTTIESEVLWDIDIFFRGLANPRTPRKELNFPLEKIKQHNIDLIHLISNKLSSDHPIRHDLFQIFEQCAEEKELSKIYNFLLSILLPLLKRWVKETCKGDIGILREGRPVLYKALVNDAIEEMLNES